MYSTIIKANTNTITIKKSVFISNCFYVKSEKQVEEYVHKIRKEHYKANHNCYAYRISGDYINEKANDDGEPSSTAGLPILDQLRHRNLQDVFLVVTRYFGGVKLGKGGLIRAYSQSAGELIKKSEVVDIESFTDLKLTTDYKTLGKVEYYLNSKSFIISDSKYLDDVEFTVPVNQDNLETLKKDLIELSNNLVTLRNEKVYLGYISGNKVIKL